MVQLDDINSLYIDEDGDWALSYELEKPVEKKKKKYYSNLKPIFEEVKEQVIVRKSGVVEDLYHGFYNFDINNFTFNIFNLCRIFKKN